MHILLVAMGIFLLGVSLGLSSLSLSETEYIIFFSLALIMFSMAKAYKMIKVIYNKGSHEEEDEEEI